MGEEGSYPSLIPPLSGENLHRQIKMFEVATSESNKDVWKSETTVIKPANQLEDSQTLKNRFLRFCLLRFDFIQAHKKRHFQHLTREATWNISKHKLSETATRFLRLAQRATCIKEVKCFNSCQEALCTCRPSQGSKGGRPS